ncbi:MAG: iron-molybdenum cofactor biosynthesis protein [Ignavibacteriales bacterium]|nr:iron-molybdenum cofactor biosynthesis protein [Ignavibacteriales bacterium]
MRIAIASDDGIKIAGHFGRARGFVYADVEDGEVKNREFKANDITGHAQGHTHGHAHGQHSHAPIIAALEGVDAVISRGMGRRIYDDLMAAGKRALITEEVEVDNAVAAYVKGDLEDFPERGCHQSHHH